MNQVQGDPTPQPERLRQTPSWLITQSATIAHRLVGEALGAVGAKRYHYALLSALEQFGPTSQAELGRRCSIDRSDVVATVNELVEQKYVERAQDPGNRRQNIITLTRNGSCRLNDLDRVLADTQNQLLDGLSETQRNNLVEALGSLLDHQSSH